MKRIGFDNDKYLSMQSAHIRERIEQFGDKLYLGLLSIERVFIMPPAYFRDLHRTANYRCSYSLQIRQK